MRRVLACAAALVLAAGVVACGSDDSGDSSGAKSSASSDSGKPKLEGKIAVLLPDSKSSDRWETADRRFFEEAFKAAGLSTDDYLISNAEGDPATQRSAGRAAITQGRPPRWRSGSRRWTAQPPLNASLEEAPVGRLPAVRRTWIQAAARRCLPSSFGFRAPLLSPLSSDPHATTPAARTTQRHRQALAS